MRSFSCMRGGLRDSFCASEKDTVMKKLMVGIAAMLLATATAWGWGDYMREKVIDGRTFSYRFFWTDDGYTNVIIYAISPQDGDVVIPSRIDDTDNVGLGTITIGSSQHQDIAGPGTTSVHLPPSATYIPDYCFQGCANLTNINLECVTKFGIFAFDQCPNLVTMVHVRTNTEFIASSYRASLGQSCTFRGCVSLKDVIIDEGVKSLGGTGVFSGCGIESVELPPTLQSMNSTFCGTPLREIDIPDSVKDVGGSFGGCTNLVRATIGRGVEVLDRGDFVNCSALESVIFRTPTSLVMIGGRNIGNIGTFNGCTSLVAVEIPEGVVSLGTGAFSSCNKLSRITLPESLRSIGSSSFYGCTSLKTVDIPIGVTNIADCAFWYAGLGEAIFPDGLERLGSIFYRCYSLTNVVIPSSVKVIDGTFHDCTGLESVTIPDGIVDIDGAAFSGCTSLKSLTIPDGVGHIGNGALSNLELPQIVIPGSVTNIEDYAFQNYRGEIVFSDPTPTFSYRTFYCCFPSKVTFLGGFPTSLSYLDGSTYESSVGKYVVTEEHLHEWLPWFVAYKNTNYAILDETAQEEVLVVLGEGGADIVGVMASLGLSPSRSTDGTVATATFAKPKIEIAAFDPRSERMDVLVTPADGGSISGCLVSECVSVEWSDDLRVWSSLPSVAVDGASYLKEETKGLFSCTFDASGHRFYKVKVVAR